MFSLQTDLEKFRAAPTPSRKRRRLVETSPLVQCPQVGVVCGSDVAARKRDLARRFQAFRPLSHAHFERHAERVHLPKRMRMEQQFEMLDAAFAELIGEEEEEHGEEEQEGEEPEFQKPSPQLDKLLRRRVRSPPKRSSSSRLVEPERGRLTARQPANPMTVARIIAARGLDVLSAVPKVLEMMLVARMVRTVRSDEPEARTSSEKIARERAILYQKEGMKWDHLFFPNDDPTSAWNQWMPVFGMFDNTDANIADAVLGRREQFAKVLTAYQFRVLAKRSALPGFADAEERVVLGEILGIDQSVIFRALILMQSNRKIKRNLLTKPTSPKHEAEGKEAKDVKTIVFNICRRSGRGGGQQQQEEDDA